METFSKITLHQGDCIGVMKGLPDMAFDLAICDPPYGIGAGDYQRGGTKYGKSVAVCKTYEKKQWDKMPPHWSIFKN
jgi:site-specific DNA-methyltransferase (adenine-specific)